MVKVTNEIITKNLMDINQIIHMKSIELNLTE